MLTSRRLPWLLMGSRAVPIAIGKAIFSAWPHFSAWLQFHHGIKYAAHGIKYAAHGIKYAAVIFNGYFQRPVP
jgi:hypothetical protein